MGVKDLKKFLREHSLVKRGNICQYTGKKIALDVSSYIYKYMMIFPDNWLSCFPNFICLFKESDVHCTFVFDGKAPPEKDKEREKRRQSRNDAEEKVFNISFDLETYKNTGNISPLLKETMDKISDGTTSHSLLLLEKKEEINIEKIEEYISKKEKQNTPLKQKDIQILKDLLTHLGVPYIQSPVEAEALCAYLYSKGEVDAVITEDTDILAYGVETFISGINSKTGECEVVCLSKVLKELDMTLQSFLDFCIMCGTDYNSNIPNIGIKKAFKLITDHKSIESVLEKLNEEGTCLNTQRTRELFTTYGNIDTSGDIKTSYWEIKRDLVEAYRYMREHRIRFSMETMERLWGSPEIVFCEDE